MDARFVEAESEEWDEMWFKLAMLPINDQLEEKSAGWNNGECWQYMGTYDEFHSFRHRCHPTTNNREYVTLKAKGELCSSKI